MTAKHHMPVKQQLTVFYKSLYGIAAVAVKLFL